MPIRIRAAEARNNFSELLGRAHFGREVFLIEKQGKPFAVVMGLEEYLRLVGSLTVDGSPEPGAEGEPDGAAGPPSTSR